MTKRKHHPFGPRVKLSKNFTYGEMTKSKTAQRMGIKNIPNYEQLDALIDLCVNILQPIRDHFKKPVHVNSGFRGTEVNNAVPGSSRTSQHKKGEAADIEIYGISNIALAEWIRDNLEFDQLILEYHTLEDINSGWVHVSYTYRRRNRRQVLSKLSGEKRYRKGLVTQ